MIKRTLYFGNPCFLSTKNNQLIIQLKETESNSQVPIEDIGVLILDNPQIVTTHTVYSSLLNNNAAIIQCDEKHLPLGLMLPLEGHTQQSERFRFQIDAALPLKKQLWQQTIIAKLRNQAQVLKRQNVDSEALIRLANEVKSGDTENKEGQGAAYYWPRVFRSYHDFRRHREGDFPNPLLNYGYAILRAIVARSLVGSGLLPTLGIHHHNRYNAFCLADDIMEPYRPFVDQLIVEIIDTLPDETIVNKEIKKRILQIPVLDVVIEGKSSPLMIALQTTSASLAKCFLGQCKQITYPYFP